jgi:hypothetical protein
MKAVKYINPEGAEVEVPEADAAHFDEIGWKRSEATPAKENKPKNTKNQ